MKKKRIWNRRITGIIMAAMIILLSLQLDAFAVPSDALPQLGGAEADAIEIENIASERQSVWNDYRNSMANDPGLISEMTPDGDSVCYLKYSEDITMKCYITVKGSKPEGGYPLYIALHGGGGSSPATNDSQWNAMKTYYSNELDCGVYVACRGIRDTWNCHFNAESYPLYDRLIQDLIITKDVDPNRVYIMGYSAGGDGVYGITPSMADRFAGANMSAGHPNGVNMINMKHVPITLQVGELDGSYDRNLWVPRYDALLDALSQKYGGYTHKAFVHKGREHSQILDRMKKSTRDSKRDQYLDAANTWELYIELYDQYDYWDYAQYDRQTMQSYVDQYNAEADKYVDVVMKDTQAWLQAKKIGGTYTDTEDEEYYPPERLGGYTRDPIPTEIMWNLESRAAKRSVESFYWLSAPMTVKSGIVSAAYDKNSNTVTVDTEDVQSASYNATNEKVVWSNKSVEDKDDISILLNEEMIDFSKPVEFVINGKRYTAMVVPDRTVLEATTAERGDPNYQFEAKIKLSEIEAICNHSYGEAVYTWSADNKTCTAKAVCSQCGAELTETVDATAVETASANCENKGEMTCTAEFKNGSFETQTKKEELPALGHDYQLSGWIWTGSDADGYTVAKAEFTCSRDNSHTVSVDAELETTTVDSTCQSEGTKTYTAEVVFGENTYKDSKTTGIDVKAHNWGKADYSWEGTVCTASRSCNDCDAVQSESIAASESGTIEPTCTETGYTDYLAVFDNEAFTEQTTRIDKDALGHDFGAWKKIDDKQHERVCSRDADHRETGDHSWDAGTVTREPSETAEGEKTYKCTVCGEEIKEAVDKKTAQESIPQNTSDISRLQEQGNQKGADVTAFGKGASAAAAEAAIHGMKTDDDPKGTTIGPLVLKSKKESKNTISLSWNGASGAVRYEVYGNRCGKTRKMKKLASVSGRTFKASGLKKGTYHKFMIVALDRNDRVVASSKVIHVATKGGKNGNCKGIKVSNAAKLKKLKKGKTLKIKATASGLRVKKHVGLRYETSNSAVASVDRKGKVKAVSKGTATITVYAQNGASKRIKVTVN